MVPIQWYKPSHIQQRYQAAKEKSFAIPKPKQDIHDFTAIKQEVVKVVIVPDGYSPAVKPHAGFSIDKSPEPTPYIVYTKNGQQMVNKFTKRREKEENNRKKRIGFFPKNTGI